MLLLTHTVLSFELFIWCNYFLCNQRWDTFFSLILKLHSCVGNIDSKLEIRVISDIFMRIREWRGNFNLYIVITSTVPKPDASQDYLIRERCSARDLNAPQRRYPTPGMRRLGILDHLLRTRYVPVDQRQLRECRRHVSCKLQRKMLISLTFVWAHSRCRLQVLTVQKYHFGTNCLWRLKTIRECV